MKAFTRDNDNMNEVLADFIGHNVEVKLTNTFILRGPLEVNPAEYTDGYKIGPYEFEKDEVLVLIDPETEREEMTHLTFTQRRLEKITIKRVDEGSLLTTDSTGFGIPGYVAKELKAGDELYLELFKFNEIGGLMRPNGEYLFHRSDDYFIIQLAEFIADNKRKNEEYYQNNFVSWTFRTAKLPPRYRARLNRFLSDPDKGEEFRKEGMGWGYELIICELAVLYEKHGLGDGSYEDEPQEIMDFASKYGTSGNQHDCARAWVKNPDVAI